MVRRKKDGTDGTYGTNGPRAVMYIGPRVGYLRPGMCFVERPEFLLRYIEQCPEVEELLVRPECAAARSREMERRGSALWYVAGRVKQALGSPEPLKG